jgi:hypothetical protein
MSGTRALAVVVLLLSCGAVGARQPAVRSSALLPAPAATIAGTLRLPVADRSRIVLDIIRLLFDSPDAVDGKDTQLRQQLQALMTASLPGETVPLPLDPSIWRDSILHREVPDNRLIAEILSSRQTALLYHGLASLDDETLGWLGPERDVLEYLLEHAGIFATTARSFRVRTGRVIVPGGAAAEGTWERVVGASPERPASFARRLFKGPAGHVAFFYDTVAQLDEPAQRLALALNQPADARPDRVRALADVFGDSLGELRIAERPFSRHPVDPAITLATMRATPDGQLLGPTARWFWEAVFRLDTGMESEFVEMKPSQVPKRPTSQPVDVAWLAARIHQTGPVAARRRLDAVLFAQRVFEDLDAKEAAAAVTATRGMLAFPALMLTLERSGVRAPALLARAAARASALNAIGNDGQKRDAIRLFQASLGIIDRAVSSKGLSRESAAARISSLLALELSGKDAETAFSAWLRTDFLRAITPPEGVESVEQAVLAALSGGTGVREIVPVVEWEGRRYVVNPETAELRRLRRVRERQRGPTLDDVLPDASDSNGSSARARENGGARALADVLTSILYAAYVGDPDGRILSAGNVALRHDLGFDTGGRARPLAPWQFAIETFGQESGWRLRGSLLGLQVALGPYRLRRIDFTTMPPAPRLTTTERQSAALTAALLQPRDMTDEAMKELAAAIRRGRARFTALTERRDGVERVAQEAALSGWRREGLAWAVEHDRGSLDSYLSLLELFWLGGAWGGRVAPDAWGAAAQARTGCLCLEMPRALPWEYFAGRPSIGLQASRAADVTLRLAEEFDTLRIPSLLVPGAAAFAVQDAIDAAQPAYLDDWTEFARAVREIPHERVLDYVAALTAGGPLLRAETESRLRE